MHRHGKTLVLKENRKPHQGHQINTTITAAPLFYICATLSEAVLPFLKPHLLSRRDHFVRAFTSNNSAILDGACHAVRLFKLKLHTGLEVQTLCIAGLAATGQCLVAYFSSGNGCSTIVSLGYMLIVSFTDGIDWARVINSCAPNAAVRSDRTNQYHGLWFVSANPDPKHSVALANPVTVALVWLGLCSFYSAGSTPTGSHRLLVAEPLWSRVAVHSSFFWLFHRYHL